MRKKTLAKQISLRITYRQQELLSKEARRLGMELNEFIRRVLDSYLGPLKDK